MTAIYAIISQLYHNYIMHYMQEYVIPWGLGMAAGCGMWTLGPWDVLWHVMKAGDTCLSHPLVHVSVNQISLLQLHGPMICKAMQWFVCFNLQLYMHLHAKNVSNRFDHAWIISIISIISHISNYIKHFQFLDQLYPIISNYISDSKFNYITIISQLYQWYNWI